MLSVADKSELSELVAPEHDEFDASDRQSAQFFQFVSKLVDDESKGTDRYVWFQEGLGLGCEDLVVKVENFSEDLLAQLDGFQALDY